MVGCAWYATLLLDGPLRGMSPADCAQARMNLWLPPTVAFRARPPLSSGFNPRQPDGLAGRLTNEKVTQQAGNTNREDGFAGPREFAHGPPAVFPEGTVFGFPEPAGVDVVTLHAIEEERVVGVGRLPAEVHGA